MHLQTCPWVRPLSLHFSPQTASTYSWLCHTGFLLQCSALGKGLLIENQRSSVRASLGIRDAAITWPLFQQGCGVKDLRPRARLSRQTVSASVGSEASLSSSSSSLFLCQWSDIYKEMRPMFLSQAFETSALRMLLCNWVTVALKEMVMCIRPSLPLAGKKSLHKVLILISTFLFFTVIGRSCQSLLSILSSKPSNIKYDQYVLTYFSEYENIQRL